MHKIRVFQPEDVEAVAANLVVIAIAGMAHELGLDIRAMKAIKGENAEIAYSEDTKREMMARRWEIHASLSRRLDPLNVRKLMHMFFIEED